MKPKMLRLPMALSLAVALILLSGCASQNAFWRSMVEGGADNGNSENNSGYTQPTPTIRSGLPGYVSTPPQVIETHIDGEFEGWDGETVWKMDNDQIWQQAAYSYHYHYAYHPAVIIYPGDFGWEMKVQGDSETVSVRRLK